MPTLGPRPKLSQCRFCREPVLVDRLPVLSFVFRTFNGNGAVYLRSWAHFWTSVSALVELSGAVPRILVNVLFWFGFYA